MGWNAKKGLKKSGQKLGGALSTAASAGPAGKMVNNGMLGVPGAVGSVLQGDNPLANTTLDKATGGKLGGLLNVGGNVRGDGGPGAAGGSGGGGFDPTRPNLPSFASPLDASGALASQYQLQPGAAVTAGSIAAGKVDPGAMVNAGSVAAGKVNAGALDINALKSDPRALDAMRERALSQGDSPWLKMSLEKQGVDQLQNADDAAKMAMSSNAAAATQAGMRGGLSAGASERMAKSGASNLNAARQQVARAGQLDRLSLGLADDQTRSQLLGQTANLDLAHGAQGQDMAKFNTGMAFDADKFNVGSALDASKFNTGLAFDANKFNSGMQFDANKFNTGMQFDADKFNVGSALDANKFNSGMQFDTNKFNTGNTLAAMGQDNTNKMGIYGEQMKGYAAGKQGDAIANSGKSGNK